MDDILAEGLEILDSPSIKTTTAVATKSKDVARKLAQSHKTHKDFSKKIKEANRTTKARFGLKQKYKQNTKVAKIYSQGKAEARAQRKQKVIQSLQKCELDTDIARWCKLTGSNYLQAEKAASDEEEESAFDDAYFEQFEKEYLEKKH